MIRFPARRPYRSRKLWLVVWTQALVLGAFVYAARSPSAAALLPAAVGGLVTLAGLYAAGNVASRHVDAKARREVEP